jgi:hypothetical protein
MLNKIIILGFALYSQLAMAFPNVGDMVHYKGYYASSNGPIQYELEWNIISHDPISDVFTINVAKWVRGSLTDRRNATAARKDLHSSDSVKQEFANCSGHRNDRDYSIEQVQVRAGNFTACKAESRGYGVTLYLADVPFGVIKRDSFDYWFELVSYKNGN